jgi:hypothetical protein
MAIITEHEQEVAPTNTQGVQQSEDEKDLVKKLNEMVERAKKFRKRYDTEWHYNYEFVVGGKQWPIERPRWRFNEVVNITWATIMTEIAIQTDARPKIEFVSQEFGDEQFVETLREVNNRNWDKYCWSSMVQDMLFDAKIYHVAHAEITWDPELEHGLGDVSWTRLDPFYSYWDPRAEQINRPRKARYFIYCAPVPTSELKLKYPDFKERLKADITDLTKQSNFSTVQYARVYTNVDPYSPTRLPSSSNIDGQQYGGEPQTLLTRIWMRDDALEELCEEKDDGEKEYVLKKKFPNGRYIEMANNIILWDNVPGIRVEKEWIPFKMTDLFPIVKLCNYQYPGEYAGENEVTQMRGPQKIFNYIWSYIMDSFRMAANPRVIISNQSGIDPEELTNEPGLVVETNDMAGYRQEPGMPIAANSFELLSRAEGMIDKIQGLQDVSRGAEQAGVDSGIMLEGYIEASQTRPRMKNRSLDYMLQDAGQIMLCHYLQFYTAPRVFRITNKEGFPEQVEFYISENEQGQQMANIRKTSQVPGQAPQAQPMQQVPIKGVPDVRVVSGSALPFAKAQKNQSANQLFTSGAIDQQELLKAIDWPNRDEVIRRMEQKAQEAAQAQAGAPPSAG